MEKYSTWRDKGTGIAPFIPLSFPKSAVSKYVIDPLLIAVKFPLFVFLYWFSVIAPKTCVNAIFTLLFGFSTDILVEGVRKLNKVEIAKAVPEKNTMVIANFASPLDIFVIYLTSNVSSLNSVLAILPIDNALYMLTPWQLAWFCFKPINHKYGTRLTSQNEDVLKNKLVVVFPEGTASNNRALLSFSPAVEPIFALKGFSHQTVLLLWYPNCVSLPIPIVSFMQYLFRLFTLTSNPLVKVKITPHAQGSLKASKLAYQDNGINFVDLGVSEKMKFFEYYQSQALT